MRKKIVLWMILIIIGFTVIYLGADSADTTEVLPETIRSNPDMPRFAIITSVEGSVLVQAADQAVALPAVVEMEVTAGDRISTGSDGYVELLFDDGSISRIGPNSRIEIEELYREGDDGPEVSSIKVFLGAIWNNVRDVVARNSRFDVNTPTAVAGVRGTLFAVKITDNGATLFRVYDGMVGAALLNPGSEFMIGAFQQALFVPGEAPPDGAEPIDFSTIDEFELLNLLIDSPDVFIALLELAAELGEQEFLQWVNDLLNTESFIEALGDNLENIMQILGVMISVEPEPEMPEDKGSEPDGSDPETQLDPPQMPEIDLDSMDFGFNFIGGGDPAPAPEPDPDPDPDPDPEQMTIYYIAGYHDESLNTFERADELGSEAYGTVDPTSEIVLPDFSAEGSTAEAYDSYGLFGWFDTVDNYPDNPITNEDKFEPEGPLLFDGAEYWAIFRALW